MKKYRSLVMGILVSVVLVACGSKLTQKNFDKINDNMSPKQVKAILGSPTRTATSTMPVVGMEITTFTYRDKKSEAEIVFRDNHVMAKTGNFEE